MSRSMRRPASNATWTAAWLAVVITSATPGCSPSSSEAETPPTPSSTPSPTPPATEPAAEPATEPDLDRLSPFQAIEQRDDEVWVQVDDEIWYILRSIDGAPIEALMQTARDQFDGRAWKRVREDLAMVLRAHGLRPGRQVALVLHDPRTDQEVRMPAVEMTRDKREACRKRADGPGMDEVLKRELWHADLSMLQQTLAERHSYFTLRGVDVEAAFAEAEQRLGEGPATKRALGLEVMRILARFGDGHTRLRGALAVIRPERLPFRLATTTGGVLAYSGAPPAPIDPAHPYVVAIDGEPLSAWSGAAAIIVSHGSPQFRRRQQLRRVVDLGQLREFRGLPAKPTAVVTLTDGREQVDETVSLIPLPPPAPPMPPLAFETIEGNIGWLQIHEMFGDPEPLDRIDEAMKAMADTRGLIIDVRGNGGGTRQPLRRLFPYFMAPDAAPVVANVAAHRRSKDAAPDPEALANRFLYPADHERWSDAERAAIARFAEGFTPQWTPPADQFSDWHYFVLGPTLNPRAYHYDRPVVVVLDSGCYSATDIFLGAFRHHTDAIFVGQPSGGGSGRSRSFELPNSRLRLRVSSMASFQPDGRLYDGVGISVDHERVPTAEDVLGRADGTRDLAVSLIESAVGRASKPAE